VAQTFVQNVVHMIFSTKERRKIITKPMQAHMWRYVAAICQENGIFVHSIGGMEDHIHILVQIPPTMTIAQAVRLIKSNSSKWMNELGHRFAWQKGYGGFSVSASKVSTVVRYIENQERHHRKMNFDEEFLAMLRKHGVEFDLKYVFG
jgi:putative transposase